MDIGQILQKYKGLDFLGMSKEEVDKFVIEIVGDLEQIKIITDDIRECHNALRNRSRRIKLDEELAANQKRREELENQGVKIGDVYYIERHEGLYVITSITNNHIRFGRYLEGASYERSGRGITCSPTSIDPSLTPLRKQGPYKVGTVVMRFDEEYTVMGYMGYRMVIKGNRAGASYYRIIQKKDEHTYKSIII